MEFAVTYDYRCPFAHVAHDHVLDALTTDPGWRVHFVPFSQSQSHVADGEPDVWDHPERDSGLLALQVSVAVRDTDPMAFRRLHRALFDLRHVEGRRYGEAELREVLDRQGLDADAVLADVAGGAPLEVVRKEHEAVVAAADVWGVPTFLVGGRAAFIRLMSPAEDAAAARRAVERILDLVAGWPELNELKHTTLER